MLRYASNKDKILLFEPNFKVSSYDWWYSIWERQKNGFDYYIPLYAKKCDILCEIGNAACVMTF